MKTPRLLCIYLVHSTAVSGRAILFQPQSVTNVDGIWQGVNLGLADAAALADSLAEAVQSGSDIGDANFLAVNCRNTTTSLSEGPFRVHALLPSCDCRT